MVVDKRTHINLREKHSAYRMPFVVGGSRSSAAYGSMGYVSYYLVIRYLWANSVRTCYFVGFASTFVLASTLFARSVLFWCWMHVNWRTVQSLLKV